METHRPGERYGCAGPEFTSFARSQAPHSGLRLPGRALFSFPYSRSADAKSTQRRAGIGACAKWTSTISPKSTMDGVRGVLLQGFNVIGIHGRPLVTLSFETLSGGRGRAQGHAGDRCQLISNLTSSRCSPVAAPPGSRPLRSAACSVVAPLGRLSETDEFACVVADRVDDKEGMASSVRFRLRRINHLRRPCSEACFAQTLCRNSNLPLPLSSDRPCNCLRKSEASGSIQSLTRILTTSSWFVSPDPANCFNASIHSLRRSIFSLQLGFASEARLSPTQA